MGLTKNGPYLEKKGHTAKYGKHFQKMGHSVKNCHTVENGSLKNGSHSNIGNELHCERLFTVSKMSHTVKNGSDCKNMGHTFKNASHLEE